MFISLMWCSLVFMFFLIVMFVLGRWDENICENNYGDYLSY